MAKDQTQLQSKLEELLGSSNVYYQPPETLRMNYTAIRYHKKRIDSRFANNAVYTKLNCYELIVIAREPDDPVIDKILALPYCVHDRNYQADNLEHDVFTLFY